MILKYYPYSSYVTMSYTVATTLMPLRPYITAITMLLWPTLPARTLQCYILSQQLLLKPYNTATLRPRYTTLTSLGSILSQPLMPLRPYIPAITMSLWPILTALPYNATLCLNNYYSSPILQQLLCLYDLCLQLLRHHDLNCRNHYYATKALYHSNHYVSMTYTYNS